MPSLHALVCGLRIARGVGGERVTSTYAAVTYAASVFYLWSDPLSLEEGNNVSVPSDKELALYKTRIRFSRRKS